MYCLASLAPTGSLRLAISAMLRFLREAIVVAQGEAEVIQQVLFQRTLGRFSAGGVRQLPAEHLPRAAVDDRNEGTPAFAAAIHEQRCRRMMRWTFLRLTIIPWPWTRRA